MGLLSTWALPRWYPTATVLCFNTAAIDGRIFAVFAPDRLDADDLCWLANLPSRLNYWVFVGGDDQPLPEGLQVHVVSGDQILFVEAGGFPPPTLALPAMLLRLEPWLRPDRFPSPRLDQAYCLALRESQALHIEDYSLPFRFKAHLANLAGMSPNSFHVLHAEPPARDIALFGVPCRALIAPCTCGQTADQCRGVFFDLRPIQEGIRFVCCTGPQIDLEPIRAAFDTGAPFGWQSQVRTEGTDEEQAPDIHPGMCFVVDYVPCQDQAGRPTHPQTDLPVHGRDTTEPDDVLGVGACAQEQPQAVHQAPSPEATGTGENGPEQPAATGANASGDQVPSPPPGLGADDEPEAPDTAQDSQPTPRSESRPPGRALTFMLFSHEYQPEVITTGLLPPISLPAAVALIEQLRAPCAHRRSPRMVPVLPQPPCLPAAFLALPSWPAATLTVLIDSHMQSRRTFAATVPHFFSREGVLIMAGLDPSLSCQIFHRDVPWAIPTGYWIYPSEGDWIGILPDGVQPGLLPTMSQYLQGEAVTVGSDIDFWNSDVAWVLSNGPCSAAPIPEDNFAINSAQAAAVLGLHPGRFILVPAAVELTDHSFRGAPSRRVILAKQTDDWRETGDSATVLVPYILDPRPILLPLSHAEAERGIVNVATLCQRFMPRCPRGFHVRLYGGTFDADEGNHVRTVQAGDTLVVEYHPDYVRDIVSHLAPGTYSSDPSSSDDQRSTRDLPAEATSSANSSRADAGTGGTTLPRRNATRHGHRTIPGESRDTRRASCFSKWFLTFSSLHAIPDGKEGSTSAHKAQLTCGRHPGCLRRLRDGPQRLHDVKPRQPPYTATGRHLSRHSLGLCRMKRLVLFGVLGWSFFLVASCCSFLAADALIPVLLHLLLRRRGSPVFGSVLLLLALSALRGTSGVQLPSIGDAVACVTTGPRALPPGAYPGLIPADHAYPHPGAPRPLPTPRRAAGALCETLPVSLPAGIDPMLEEDMPTLLEESCTNQHGYPYYLAATLLDVLTAHFTQSVRPVLHLQDLLPHDGPIGLPTEGAGRWFAGGVPVRPFPFPSGAIFGDTEIEVTIGSTPLGFSLASLENLLKAQAVLCDFVGLCDACPEVRRIPNLGRQSLCDAHGFPVPPAGILAYTDGSFTPESTVPAKAGWAVISLTHTRQPCRLLLDQLLLTQRTALSCHRTWPSVMP